jgi:hypothetical protein
MIGTPGTAQTGIAARGTVGSRACLLRRCFLEALNFVSSITMVNPQTNDHKVCKSFNSEEVAGCVRLWEGRGYQPLNPLPPRFSNQF